MDLILDKLPQVQSCCFCCYLRGGSFMIGLFSFMAGMIFAPNVIHLVGYWNIDPILKSYDTMTEGYIQLCLGMVSVMLCTVSICLMLGSLCIFLVTRTWMSAAISSYFLSSLPESFLSNNIGSAISGATRQQSSRWRGPQTSGGVLLLTTSVFCWTCGIVKLIEAYVWGAVIYNTVTFTILFVTSIHCFSSGSNCFTAAGYITFFNIIGMTVAFYFLIVVNSLRLSLKFMNIEQEQNYG